MTDLFQAIGEYETAAEKRVFTVLDGKEIGEKVLLVDGALAWESRKGGFFSHKTEELGRITESGIVVIDGYKVFCDVLGNEKRLVICGAGHVSIPVIRIGLMLGWEVTVLEDRPMYADDARRAGVSRVICEPFAEGLDKIKGDADTYFVIVTRGHRYDKVCLERIARKEHAYIGMIGSRRRVAMVKEELAEQGIDRDVLDGLYAPIGLKIGAETPAEIAVAIMAEIIEVNNKKRRTCGYSKEIIKAVMDKEKASQGKVLVTIISRRGSAPRGIGTKMLVFQDGSCIGTIGGGCMEANVLQKAYLMAAGDGPMARVCHVDLTGQDAEEDGMACGGVVDVFLEVADTSWQSIRE